jgi:hypothetical protein
VNNYLMEEDLPPIDAPPKTDEELGRVPVPLPDDFGEELGIGSDDPFSSTQAPVTPGTSSNTGLHPGIIVAIVVVVVLVIALVVGVIVYLKRRQAVAVTA